VSAQEVNQSRPLFESNDLLRVRIEAPFTSIMKDRESDEYRDGSIRLIDSTGTEESFDLKIRTRGNFRRKASHCHFAPLRINFRKKQVNDSLFQGQDKLKLVTHCENSGKEYEQSLLLEYLAYRMFNQLTDLSFRVRLLLVDYADTERDGYTRTRYGFLIEHDKELSRRIGMEMATVEAVTAEELDQHQSALFSAFQYLIGNTDFSAVRGAADATCCHNAVLFQGADERLVPVAYDFDQAGLVDSPYAAPNPDLPIKDVKQRLYRGFCSYSEFIDDAVRLAVEQRSNIEQLFEEQDGLLTTPRRAALRYIDEFYDRVSSPSNMERYLIEDCTD